MTLQSSGSMTGADIRNELRQSGGNLVFPDPTTRYLSDRASGSITIPTHFYGKTAVKRVHTELITGGNSTSFSTTANLGVDFTGRRLIVCLACLGVSAGSQILMPSVTLGGSALNFGPGWAFWINGVVNCSNGIATDVPSGVSGTSATLTVNFSQAAKTLRIIIYSVANIGNTFSSNSNGTNASASVSTNVAIDTNGVVIAQGAYYGNGGGMAFGFVNEDTDTDIGDSVKFGTAFINRLGAQGGQAISVTGSGSVGFTTVAAMSFGS
jgi:hypothetical protein